MLKPKPIISMMSSHQLCILIRNARVLVIVFDVPGQRLPVTIVPGDWLLGKIVPGHWVTGRIVPGHRLRRRTVLHVSWHVSGTVNNETNGSNPAGVLFRRLKFFFLIIKQRIRDIYLTYVCTKVMVKLTLSWTVRIQIPWGCSPQVATDIKGQLMKPAFEVSWGRALNSWTLVPRNKV